jgi:hypothetical protein
MLTFGLTQSNDLNLRLALAFDLHNYNRTETSKDVFHLFSLSFKKIILIFSGCRSIG